jgi:serine/threonine protein kinase
VGTAIPGAASGLQNLIQDAAQLSARYDDLTEEWRREQGVYRAPDDDRRLWRGWLGFCVLSAYVAGFADPARPPDDRELGFLRAIFADDSVQEVVLRYYASRPGDRSDDESGPEPIAHRTQDDGRVLTSIANADATLGLLPGPAGEPTSWTWQLHRVGTSALVLAATPDGDGARRKLAVKVIAPPYLRWEDIRRAAKESGRLSVESEALARNYGATEAMLVTSFVEGPTLTEVMADRDARLRASGGDDGGRTRRYSEDDGVRFALAYWLPVVRSLAVLHADLPGTGHGDLNPSNVILSGHAMPSTAEAEALGLAQRRKPRPGQWVVGRVKEVTLTGPVDRLGRRDAKAVLVDLGPSHLLHANPGSGLQSVSHLSRYTAPELLEPGSKSGDRQRADLYSLGDLLLDALVPGQDDDGDRVERVYRHSFELGQLVDSLRSYDPSLRTAVHQRPGRPLDWSEFVDQVERILMAADTFGGTGLRKYSLLGVFRAPGVSEVDLATGRTGPEDRAATLGSRETWPINWFRFSRAFVTFLVGTIASGVLVYSTVGCDSPFGGGLCTADDLYEGTTELLGLDNGTVLRLGVLAVAVTWVLAGHLYYVRIFAQLRPALCHRLRWRLVSEITIRVAAAPAYALVLVCLIWPTTWWLLSALVAFIAGANNWFFTRFLGSAVDWLRQSARGPAPRDSLASAANAVEAFVEREYGMWWLLMTVYGVACLAMGAGLEIFRRGLRSGDMTSAEVADAVTGFEFALIVMVVVVNLVMLYRNCSEMGQKAPQVRANGARAIAGYLRLDQAGKRPAHQARPSASTTETAATSPAPARRGTSHAVSSVGMRFIVRDPSSSSTASQ